MKHNLGHTIAAAALGLASIAHAQISPSTPIKIGVVTPLSGTYAGIGQTVRWGLELATAEINASGGVLGRKLELLLEDEEANPAVAVQKAEKLIQIAKVNLLTGTVNSGSTLAVGQLAERNNVLASTTVSYSDAITGDKCSPNLFRVNARAEQQAITLAAYVAKVKPKARVFYIGPDYEMGRSSVAAFKLYAEKAGLQSVGEFLAPIDSKDYTQYFGQLRAARPDVIYAAVAGNDTVRLLTQLQEFGLLRNVLVTGNAGVINSQNVVAVGTAGEGFISGNNYSPKIDTAENKRFVASYKAAYKADPDGFAADSYGLVYLYKQAVEKAGSTDTDKVRAALKDLSWMTPQGTKTLRGGDHQAIQDMVVVAVRKGEFDVVGKVPGAESIGPDACARF